MTKLLASARLAGIASIGTCLPSAAARPRSRRVGAPLGPREAEKRIAEILDAAVRVVAARGLAAASIDDVAQDAGISKGTFYHYFQSRDAMLEALITRHEASVRMLLSSDRVLKGAGDWDRKTARFARIVYGTTIEGLDRAGTLDIVAELSRAEGVCLPHPRLIREFLTEGVVRADWQISDVATAAAFLHGGACEVVRQAARKAGRWPALCDRIGDLFVAFLRAFVGSDRSQCRKA